MHPHVRINTLQKKMDAFVRWLHVLLFSCEQVLIFAEKKADVDAIHEYLLLKGVEAVAIHGGKGTQLQTALRTPPIAFLRGKFFQSYQQMSPLLRLTSAWLSSRSGGANKSN